MYTVVLMLALPIGADAPGGFLSCLHRHRGWHGTCACPAPCDPGCSPGPQDSSDPPVDGPSGSAGPGADPTTKTPDDQKHRDELLSAYGGDTGAQAQIRDYYQKATREQWRAFYRDEIAKVPPQKTVEDQKQLDALLTLYKNDKDAQGKIRDYYKSATPKDWREFYGDEMKKAGRPAAKTTVQPKPKTSTAVAQPARIIVFVPADAQLTIDGRRTSSTSSVRVFATPPLPPGVRFTYALHAKFVRHGEPVSVVDTVRVRAGQESTVHMENLVAAR